MVLPWCYQGPEMCAVALVGLLTRRALLPCKLSFPSMKCDTEFAFYSISFLLVSMSACDISCNTDALLPFGSLE